MKNKAKKLCLLLPHIHCTYIDIDMVNSIFPFFIVETSVLEIVYFNKKVKMVLPKAF